MPVYKIKSINSSYRTKKLNLLERETKREARLEVPRYSLFSPNNLLDIPNTLNGKVFVINPGTEEKIQVLPIWNKELSSKFGNIKFDYKITELKTREDFENYSFLESFHYRSNDVIESEEDGFSPKSGAGGKSVILLLYIRIRKNWIAVGYVNIQQPLQMCEPRHKALNSPYENTERNISWEKWSINEMTKNLGLFARIGRIVVSPEFRGIGLAKILIQETKSFINEKWHVNGQRPLFLEITAEMLKYINFVKNTEFIYLGNTKGNAARFVKDMEAMKRGQKIEFGIMSLQQKYLQVINNYLSRKKMTWDELKKFIQDVIDEKILYEELDNEQWLFIKSILRNKKPYYLMGLDKYTHTYILNYAKDNQIIDNSKIKEKKTSRKNQIKKTKEIKFYVKIINNIQIKDTKFNRMILESFGLKFGTIKSEILDQIEISASQGNICLILGPSGTGKSLLLESIDKNFTSNTLEIDRDSRGMDFQVARLPDFKFKESLIDYFAKKYGMEKSVKVLSSVGLSEAFIFLKNHKILSQGQLYRAKLAELLLRDEPIWILDEFCSDLDPMTAKVIAHNLRKTIINQGKICFIAAANYEHFIKSLNPHKIILLRHGGSSVNLTYKEFLDNYDS